ncbi:hypothetical protein LOTGIDRAFT_234689 [Lottia gigantea]|uniref:Phosphoribulokinase/uridine kinase domain-containing protein n=1 Tax=Lottia gigantea TaxID=225164 RepID=V4A4D4_LOTGI|nr:hypothetical protein LOTGIDRAFT_234689 [Lottia gigantea]ESO88116.1 hypothetical protein LOTGIDRAFT_234689 [Lottia gigantea]
MSEDNNYVIIGISGCTNSGKTTMTDRLLKLFPSASQMCQDTYFLEPGDERLEFVPEVNHSNWEKLSALDMDRMVRDVKQWIKDSKHSNSHQIPILFIEGFTIFNHSPLKDLCNKKYFFTMDFETCQERRSGRNYIPADPEGYFEKIVWPMYFSNKSELNHYKDIVYLNGCDPQEKTLKTILEDIYTLPALKKLHFIS